MGPITLFDKSFIQNLTVDESVWFDHFFNTVLCPLFYVETLSDLTKVTTSRTPKKEVQIISDKCPQMHITTTMFHHFLSIQNLLGVNFPMDGRPIMPGGINKIVDGEESVVFKEAPEVKAFQRWQDEDFHNLEINYAQAWRDKIKSLKTIDIIKTINKLNISCDNVRNLAQAKSVAENYLNEQTNKDKVFIMLQKLLRLNENEFLAITKRWFEMGRPLLKEFAPYVYLILIIELFYYIAITAKLISPKLEKNRVDMLYLYYLPFCSLFVSSDKLHRNCVPLFLRDDQKFIWGLDLKRDLAKIDLYYDQFSEDQKAKGLYSIAPRPPKDGEFLVSKLWDFSFPNWREKDVPIAPDLDSEFNSEEVKKINRIYNADPISIERNDYSEPDSIIIQHNVKKRRGKWWVVDKNIKEV